MRVARKLFLFAALAVTAVAFAAPAASGQIEVIGESAGMHCTDVPVSNHEASGECEINAHSIDSPYLPPMFGDGVLFVAGGTVLSVCENEFEAYLAEDGSGLITHQQFEDVAGLGDSCQIQSCTEPGMAQEPWPAQWLEPHAGEEDLTLVLCVTAVEGEGTPCEITVTVDQSGHSYLFKAEHSSCHGIHPLEVVGTWEGEEIETNATVVHPG